MIVYLSCDSQNKFFIKMVSEGVEDLKSRLSSDSVVFIYPPEQIGGDTGKVLSNVLRIREADLVIFDITPRLGNGIESYNPGVMIEFGIVLALENPMDRQPWGGRQPRPTYRVFCDAKYPRSNLTPLVNESSVISYSVEDRDDLKKKIRSALDERVTQRMTYSIEPSKDTFPRVSGY